MSRKVVYSENKRDAKNKVLVLCQTQGCRQPAALPDGYCPECAAQIAIAETCPLCGRKSMPGELCESCLRIYAPDEVRYAS